MIELLLQAERALNMGLVDQAEYLYRQAAAADPRNSIAVVGLGRVALERDDEAEAYRQAKRALAIDPENAAASRMIERLEDVLAPQRVVPIPVEPSNGTATDGQAAVTTHMTTEPEPARASRSHQAPEPEPEAEPEAEAEPEPEAEPKPEPVPLREPEPEAEANRRSRPNPRRSLSRSRSRSRSPSPQPEPVAEPKP